MKLSTAIQKQAVTLLAQGFTDSQVARDLGCDRSTLWRWKQDPEFMAAVDDEQQAIQKDVQRILRGFTLDAARRIGELVNEDDCPHRVQLDSAREILNRVGAMEPQAPVQGIDPAWVSKVIDDLGQQLSQASWENVAHYYVRFGICESVEEYLAWSEAQKSFYAIALDSAARFWAGERDFSVDPELMQWWAESRAKETPEETQAWLEKQHQKVGGTIIAADVEFVQINQIPKANPSSYINIKNSN